MAKAVYKAIIRAFISILAVLGVIGYLQGVMSEVGISQLWAIVPGTIICALVIWWLEPEE